MQHVKVDLHEVFGKNMVKVLNRGEYRKEKDSRLIVTFIVDGKTDDRYKEQYYKR